MEAQDLLCTVLETILEVKEKFKEGHIIDIVIGKETSEVVDYKHHELDVFGTGKNEDISVWSTVIRQALISGYIDKEIENYGVLKVTKAGKAFLSKPKSFKITKDE